MNPNNDAHVAQVEAITKSCPMEYLYSHPFFMIRWIENNRRKVLLNTVAPKRGEVIADIGCERGHMLTLLHKRCPEIAKLYGVDLSQHALGEARRTIEWAGFLPRCELIHCDAARIKLPDNSVDVAISANVLEHLHDPQRGFDELVRITRPGGRIILNLPNEKRIVLLKRMLANCGLRRLLGNLQLNTPGHLHYPDKKFIRDLSRQKAVVRKLFCGPKISLFGLYVYAVIEPVK